MENAQTEMEIGNGIGGLEKNKEGIVWSFAYIVESRVFYGRNYTIMVWGRVSPGDMMFPVSQRWVLLV